MNHRQAQPRAFSDPFGGEKRLENTLLGFAAHPRAGIGDHKSKQPPGVPGKKHLQFRVLVE